MDGIGTRRLIAGAFGFLTGVPKLVNFSIWFVGLAGFPGDLQTWLVWVSSAPWPWASEMWSWIILAISVALFIWPTLIERGYRWVMSKSLTRSPASSADLTLTDAYRAINSCSNRVDTDRLRECAGSGQIAVWGRPQQEPGGLEIKGPTFGLEVLIPPEYWVRNDISWITLVGTERTVAHDGGETYGKLRLNKSQLQKAGFLD